MANNQATIAAFLAGKGLSAVAIAALMGNMQIESNFSTTASNSQEGAIGLVQWEGGRRTALQNFAKAEGTTETDINAQLGFMWQELTTGYSSVLTQLKSATSVTAAAQVVQAHYEVSSTASLSQREAAANALYGSGGSGIQGLEEGATELTSPAGVASATQPASTTSAADYTQDSGLGALLSSVPDLQNVLNQAVAGQWSSTTFENAIQNTPWYKSNSATVRSQLALQASDPATYTQNLTLQANVVAQAANSLGVTLTAAQTQQLAAASLSGNWSTADLQQNVAVYWSNTASNAQQSGQAATVQQQIEQQAAAYGIPVSSALMNQWTQSVLAGWNTVDGFTAYAKNVATSMYPGLSAQIAQGMDVKTIADPYVQTMANLLEVDPATLSASTPLIAKALQGTVASSGGAQSATSAQPAAATPLWQFAQQVRSDPSWQYTVNAKQATAATLSQIGQDWGFGVGVPSQAGIAATGAPPVAATATPAAAIPGGS